MSQKTRIIAEAGVNHNGDIEIAERLVQVAADSGADYVKFQTFQAKEISSKIAGRAEYQKKNMQEDGTQITMLQKLELDLTAHKRLLEACEANQIKFLSTPFDLPSIDLLFQLGVNPWKIPSGEITNYPFLRKIGSLKQEIILSTGMSTMADIQAALAVLEEAGTPREKITILHCTTEYPAPFADVNLRAMESIRRTFGVKVGYSDHTEGIEISLAAVAMGATTIEKHFTLDKSLPGPDHKASLEPGELKSLIQAVRHIEQAMGDGIKRPLPSELKNVIIARKSIVAKIDITKGEMFTEANITPKRPGHGISPMRWNEILGLVATRDFEADELIEI